MNVEPYLFLNGRCEEAIDFYRDALGASLIMLMRYRDSPDAPSMPLPPGWGDKVMHASFRIGETRLMASDGCSAEPTPINGVALSVQMPDASAAQRAFAALADGGDIQMPLSATFFSPCFGMLRDRFGVAWMLIVPE